MFLRSSGHFKTNFMSSRVVGFVLRFVENKIRKVLEHFKFVQTVLGFVKEVSRKNDLFYMFWECWAICLGNCKNFQGNCKCSGFGTSIFPIN